MEEKTEKKLIKVKELYDGMKNVNFDAKVVEMSDVREFRKDGENCRAVTVKLADETGTCGLSLFDEWVDKVKLHDNVLIRNAYCKGLDSYDNLQRITLGKFPDGKLVVLKEPTVTEERIE